MTQSAADEPAPPPTSPPPAFATHHTFIVTINAPWFADLLIVLGGKTIAEKLQSIEASSHSIEATMSAFSTKLDKLETTLDAFDAREAKEDEEHVLSKAEVTRLKKELADLQALRDSEKSTPEDDARFEAVLARIEGTNKVPNEVLPDTGGGEAEPEPTA